MLRKLSTTAVILTGLFASFLMFAYTTFQHNVNGTATASRWPGGKVSWSLNPTLGTNVDDTSGANPLPVATALANAFAAWQGAQLKGQSVTTLSVRQGPNSAKTDPDQTDCTNLITFVPSSSVDFATGTIATTTVTSVFGPVPSTYNCGSTPLQTASPSQIIDADIAFNPQYQFSTSTPSLPGHYDLQSIATHEVGHLLGLEHDGIAHAVMYPFGDSGIGQTRTLSTDDVAGIAYLYPAGNFAAVTGSIAGQVSLNGDGLYAAHVVAVNQSSGAAVVDGLSSPDGSYKLVGVPPGTYQVLVEPLTGVYTLSDFNGWTCGYATNPTDCTSAPQNQTNYAGVFY
ncbi:MAG: matrixin family metalloprotease [Terriglobia bacterium]